MLCHLPGGAPCGCRAALRRCQERSAALLASSAIVTSCSSFGARQRAANSAAERCQELQYCEGLELLLARALLKAATQVSAARAAFEVGSSGDGANSAADGSSGGSAHSTADEYECADDEDEVHEVI